MKANRSPGEIITFYSYKGGAGRTMALANIAYWLAVYENKSVLSLDWDLEAPGLHRYFHLSKSDTSSLSGLIEFFEQASLYLGQNEYAKLSDFFCDFFEEHPIQVYKNLYLLKAGKLDENYPDKIHAFNWRSFFEKYPSFFDSWITFLTDRYDYILIDSRTGLTDTGGICTMIMPEKVVVVFTPNNQSLLGVTDTIESWAQYRVKNLDHRPFMIYPLPSRIELGSEKDLFEEWRKKYCSIFEDKLKAIYNLSYCNLNPYLDKVAIFHEPKYAFGEQIAVQLEGKGKASSINSNVYRYKNLIDAINSDKNVWDFSILLSDNYQTALTRIKAAIEEESKNLDLSKLELPFLPPEIDDISTVENLNLSGNYLSNITFLCSLPKLISLNLKGNNIKVIAAIEHLQHLVNLNLCRNKIESIGQLGSLKNLQYLDASHNQIENLSGIEALSSLDTLNLSENKLIDVKPLFKIKNLRSINLDNNIIANLHGIADLQHLENLSVNTNPIGSVPPEIVNQGIDHVINYYNSLQQDIRPLNQLRVMILGDGAVGKTSLVKRLTQIDFDPNESQTHGIQIKTVKRRINNKKITIHYWDFGGQEIMHSTHRLFLTDRCLYVLVLDSRRDEKIEYWLKTIQNIGKNSPVLVILNKIDQNLSYGLNERRLKEEYENVRGFIRVSCKTNLGILDFQEYLDKEILAHDLTETMLPTSWVQAIELIKDLNDDHINNQVFKKICWEQGIKDANDQDLILNLLHDLGIAFHDENLKEFKVEILNPLWLTNAIYQIINSAVITQKQGFFSVSDLITEFNKEAHEGKIDRNTSIKLPFILALMKEFELCFNLTDDTYIIPELLPVEQPFFQFPKESISLKFIVEYPKFFPPSIFPRLIVCLNEYIYDNNMWRTGMILHEKERFKIVAYISSDRLDRKIYIEIVGEDRRNFLTIIRQAINSINKTFQDIEIIESIPLPDLYNGSEILVSYKELIGYETMGELTFSSGKLLKKYNVVDLLAGIESPEIRKKRDIAIKVFIAYSGLDQTFKDELVKNLMPLVRLNKIYLLGDGYILPGYKWENEIVKQLSNADIVICLISSDFIISDFAYSQELQLALMRHEKGEKIVVPVLIKPCAWDNLPIAKIQSLPRSWIESVHDDKAWWTEFTVGFKKIVQVLQEHKVIQ